MRASCPFSTTKRAPESFAAVSKSISPSASPSWKCSMAWWTGGFLPHSRWMTLNVSSGPTGTSSAGGLGMTASTSLNAFS